MSVNIYIQTLDGREHPEWDSCGGGHKQFAREIMFTLPMEERRAHENPWIDDRIFHRPTDFSAWRRAVVGLPNEGQFTHMLDILDDDERYWIYISQ